MLLRYEFCVLRRDRLPGQTYNNLISCAVVEREEEIEMSPSWADQLRGTVYCKLTTKLLFSTSFN